ncbi:MAG: hypothetical protein Q4D40_01475 [Eubacteriales bacterium]|nr:hypothetical protein [Eubacteriales bacterium]
MKKKTKRKLMRAASVLLAGVLIFSPLVSIQGNAVQTDQGSEKSLQSISNEIEYSGEIDNNDKETIEVGDINSPSDSGEKQEEVGSGTGSELAEADSDKTKQSSDSGNSSGSVDASDINNATESSETDSIASDSETENGNKDDAASGESNENEGKDTESAASDEQKTTTALTQVLNEEEYYTVTLIMALSSYGITQEVHFTDISERTVIPEHLRKMRR